jgi:hypothetical protein
MFGPAHKDDDLGFVRFHNSEISSVTEIHSKGCHSKAYWSNIFSSLQHVQYWKPRFFNHTCSYPRSCVRSFGAKFVTMTLSQIFNALTKDTARENRANPAFGCELTLVTAQDSSDIGAARGLDRKVLTS